MAKRKSTKNVRLGCHNEVRGPAGEATLRKTGTGPHSMLFDNEKRLMTVEELAERLNVCRSHVYVLVNEHGLPRVKLGRAVRFQWEVVEAWLAERSFT